MERMLYTYGAIVVIGWIGFAGYELIDWRCLTATEWAAWVQALGAIGAVGAAIWIMNRQNRRAREETIEQRNFDKKSKVEILKGIYSSIKVASDIVNEKFKSSDELTNIEGDKDDRDAVENLNLVYFSDMKDSLAQVPLWEIPSAQLVTDYTIVIRRLTDFSNLVGVARRNILFYNDRLEAGQYHPDYEEAIDPAVSEARKAFFNMQDSVNAAIQRCEALI